MCPILHSATSRGFIFKKPYPCAATDNGLEGYSPGVDVSSLMKQANAHNEAIYIVYWTWKVRKYIFHLVFMAIISRPMIVPGTLLALIVSLYIVPWLYRKITGRSINEVRGPTSPSFWLGE
jgi:hypothetical protein